VAGASFSRATAGAPPRAPARRAALKPEAAPRAAAPRPLPRAPFPARPRARDAPLCLSALADDPGLLLFTTQPGAVDTSGTTLRHVALSAAVKLQPVVVKPAFPSLAWGPLGGSSGGGGGGKGGVAGGAGGIAAAGAEVGASLGPAIAEPPTASLLCRLH
jgi:hypothetical protein